MPAQGIVIGNWDEVGSTMYNARREYEQRKTDLANAEREGAPPHVVLDRQQKLEAAEAAVREANRQFTANSLWRQLNDDIERLETRLQQSGDE
jgi:type VI protein secretion system component VasF